MNYYFSALVPSALKVNGFYKMGLDYEAKKTEVESGELIEINALSSNSSVCFILSMEFLSSPPENVNVVKMQNGYLICFLGIPLGQTYKLIKNVQSFGLNLCAFCDGEYKITVQKSSEFYCEKIPFPFNNAEFYFNGNFLSVGIEGDKKAVLIYSVSPKITRVFAGRVDEFSFENQPYFKIRFCDVLGRVIKFEILFREKLTFKKTVEYTKKSRITALNLPYAFLEAFMVGDEIKEYLSDEIYQNKNSLSGYLGNFCAVIPPEHDAEKEKVGLVYKSTERTFYVKYFLFDIKNKKIINIKGCENN